MPEVCTQVKAVSSGVNRAVHPEFVMPIGILALAPVSQSQSKSKSKIESKVKADW